MIVRQRTRPTKWPLGSAVMRNPADPKWREHKYSWGEPEEKNPNLLGRVVSSTEGKTRSYKVYRWDRGVYTPMGSTDTFPSALTLLKI